MKSLASILLLFLLITMSPQAMQIFGEIAQARIISGTIDYQGNGREIIEATGIKDGVRVRIRCLWVAGIPVVIESEPVGSEI